MADTARTSTALLNMVGTNGFVAGSTYINQNAVQPQAVRDLIASTPNNSASTSNTTLATSAAGSTVQIRKATTLLSAMSGATVTATNLIPAGATVLGVVVRVTTLITGATSFKIGDGTDDDRWGTGIALTAGTTTNSSSFTAGGPVFYAANTSVVLTATGSNFTAGAVRVDVIYEWLTGPTS